MLELLQSFEFLERLTLLVMLGYEDFLRREGGERVRTRERGREDGRE